MNGAKYDQNLSIVEIAKRVRKDLKAAYPKTKFGVTIQRYAGGRSLNVKVKATEGLVCRHKVEEIVDAYNFDKSDMMTDYYHVNYSSHVDIPFDFLPENQWPEYYRQSRGSK